MIIKRLDQNVRIRIVIYFSFFFFRFSYTLSFAMCGFFISFFSSESRKAVKLARGWFFLKFIFFLSRIIRSAHHLSNIHILQRPQSNNYIETNTITNDHYVQSLKIERTNHNNKKEEKKERIILNRERKTKKTNLALLRMSKKEEFFRVFIGFLFFFFDSLSLRCVSITLLWIQFRKSVEFTETNTHR